MRALRPTGRAALVVAFAGMASVLGAGAAGCGSVEGDFCQARCDCEGCNDQRLDQCVVEERAELDKAAVFDCDDLYEQYLECRIDNPVCAGARFERPEACEDLRRRAESCYDGRRVRIDLRAP
jgi:hypothetical protein